MATEPIAVERVLKEDHTVVVTIDAAEVIEALATALQGHQPDLTLIRTLDPTGVNADARKAARDRLITALNDSPALQVILTDDAARALAEQLDTAGYPVDRCRNFRCHNLAGSDYCDDCVDGQPEQMLRGA